MQKVGFLPWNLARYGEFVIKTCLLIKLRKSTVICLLSINWERPAHRITTALDFFKPALKAWTLQFVWRKLSDENCDYYVQRLNGKLGTFVCKRTCVIFLLYWTRLIQFTGPGCSSSLDPGYSSSTDQVTRVHSFHRCDWIFTQVQTVGGRRAFRNVGRERTLLLLRAKLKKRRRRRRPIKVVSFQRQSRDTDHVHELEGVAGSLPARHRIRAHVQESGRRRLRRRSCRRFATAHQQRLVAKNRSRQRDFYEGQSFGF